MRKVILSILLSLFLIGIVDAQEKNSIDLSKSKIQWIGEYTFFYGGHEGTIDFKEGYVTKEGDNLTGGSFIIDMNSIKNTDLKDKDPNERLVDHLKESDFFDVKNFPLTELTITDVHYEDKARMKIFADLTIKGITEPISFIAEYQISTSHITAKFKIDRRRWNINYTSKWKDSSISDAIGFLIELSI